MNTVASPNPPTNHVTLRERGYAAHGSKMIGRLVDSEFDLLDAIDANTRAGTTPSLEALALTMRITSDGMARRLYRAREVGLVVMIETGITMAEKRWVPVHEYRLTTGGRKLFLEALALMDRGLVAA